VIGPEGARERAGQSERCTPVRESQDSCPLLLPDRLPAEGLGTQQSCGSFSFVVQSNRGHLKKWKFTYANEENALKRLHLQLHEPNAVSRKRPFPTLLRKVLKLPSFTSKSVSEVVLNSMSD
jgi:hypothetical protein